MFSGQLTLLSCRDSATNTLTFLTGNSYSEKNDTACIVLVVPVSNTHSPRIRTERYSALPLGVREDPLRTNAALHQQQLPYFSHHGADKRGDSHCLWNSSAAAWTSRQVLADPHPHLTASSHSPRPPIGAGKCDAYYTAVCTVHTGREPNTAGGSGGRYKQQAVQSVSTSVIAAGEI